MCTIAIALLGGSIGALTGAGLMKTKVGKSINDELERVVDKYKEDIYRCLDTVVKTKKIEE